MAETVTATVPTQHASRYLQQLSKHWSHKFAVEFDPNQGKIRSEGDEAGAKGVDMTATPEALIVTVLAPDAAALASWRQVVEDHLVRFAFREELQFDWQAA